MVRKVRGNAPGAVIASLVLLLGGAILVRMRVTDWDTILTALVIIWIVIGLSRLFRSANVSTTENFLAAASPLFDRVEDRLASEPSYEPLLDQFRVGHELSGELSGLYSGRVATLALRESSNGNEQPPSRYIEFRIVSDSLLKFTCKKWEISAGPPFFAVRVPAQFRDQPLDFLTADRASFDFWRNRPDFRAATEALIAHDLVLAVAVTPGWLLAWWENGRRERERLAALLQGVSRLAALIDQRSGNSIEARRDQPR